MKMKLDFKSQNKKKKEYYWCFFNFSSYL